MVTAADLTRLGKYAEAIKKFTGKVSQLQEVRVVKVNPSDDYVDLWVVVEPGERAKMTRKIVDIFFETLAQFSDLMFDLMVTDNDYPTSSIEVYRKVQSDASNS